MVLNSNCSSYYYSMQNIKILRKYLFLPFIYIWSVHEGIWVRMYVCVCMSIILENLFQYFLIEFDSHARTHIFKAFSKPQKCWKFRKPQQCHKLVVTAQCIQMLWEAGVVYCLAIPSIDMAQLIYNFENHN